MTDDNVGKFGAIVENGTFYHMNVGDYVQSLAAIQFIPADKSVVYLDRDNLDECHYDEEIKVVMNGWWMSDPSHFPPSENINPLYVSFHLRPRIATEELFFRPAVINHLKMHEPIGCRDKNTVKLLNSQGIKAYFSGCLTLTLGLSYQHSSDSDSPIWFVDPYVGKFKSKQIIESFFIFLRCLLSLAFHFPTVKKIAERVKLTSNTYRSPYDLYLFATKLHAIYSSTFSSHILETSNYRRHWVAREDFPTFDDRIGIAKRFLEDYSKAKYVVTSRIHCALPCLGMGTPVLLVYYSGMIKTGRLGGIKDFFKKGVVGINGKLSLDKSDFQDVKKINETFSFNNFDYHKKYLSELVTKCKNFFEKS